MYCYAVPSDTAGVHTGMVGTVFSLYIALAAAVGGQALTGTVNSLRY